MIDEQRFIQASEWTSSELERLLDEIEAMPSQQERRTRLVNVIGGLFNRAQLAELNMRTWMRMTDAWRERFAKTAEGRRLLCATTTIPNMTAGDRLGAALEGTKAGGDR